MAAMTLASVQQLASDLGARRLSSGLSVPANARPVTKIGYQIAPAYGAANQVQLVSYQVPANWQALMYGLVLGYASGSSPAPLPGDLIFTVDIDKPLGTAQGYTEKDYSNVPLALGSLIGGPYWAVEWPHVSGETIRVKGYTVSNVSTGDGTPASFLYAAMLGFEWPAPIEE